jgi:23S rRNA (pseudouridine1915-N3)-methyltransferase
LFEDYAQRVRKLGVTFDSRFVPDVKAGGRFSDAHVRERESQAVRDALPARCRVIALSPDGKTMDTAAFARHLTRWSQPLAAFVVGGPLGLDPAFRENADVSLSLSALTLPHELARVVVAEQIYRALTILRGVPYHK